MPNWLSTRSRRPGLHRITGPMPLLPQYTRVKREIVEHGSEAVAVCMARNASLHTIRRRQGSTKDAQRVPRTEAETDDHSNLPREQRVQVATVLRNHVGAVHVIHHVLVTLVGPPHTARAAVTTDNV